MLLLCCWTIYSYRQRACSSLTSRITTINIRVCTCIVRRKGEVMGGKSGIAVPTMCWHASPELKSGPTPFRCGTAACSHEKARDYLLSSYRQKQAGKSFLHSNRTLLKHRAHSETYHPMQEQHILVTLTHAWHAAQAKQAPIAPRSTLVEDFADVDYSYTSLVDRSDSENDHKARRQQSVVVGNTNSEHTKIAVKFCPTQNDSFATQYDNNSIKRRRSASRCRRFTQSR